MSGWDELLPTCRGCKKEVDEKGLDIRPIHVKNISNKTMYIILSEDEEFAFGFKIVRYLSHGELKIYNTYCPNCGYESFDDKDLDSVKRYIIRNSQKIVSSDEYVSSRQRLLYGMIPNNYLPNYEDYSATTCDECGESLDDCYCDNRDTCVECGYDLDDCTCNSVCEECGLYDCECGEDYHDDDDEY